MSGRNKRRELPTGEGPSTSTPSTSPSVTPALENDLGVLDNVEQVEQTPTLKAFASDAYTKGAKLGNGAFGAVHRMDSNTGGSAMALKTALTNGGSEDLEHEAGVLEALGSHQNIVGYGGVTKGNEGKTNGLALELLTGGDLEVMSDQLQSAYKARRISHEQYWGAMQHLLKGTTAGIGHMGEQGMVHGDLKFGNVGLNGDTFEPKVLDFGTVKNVGDEPHQANTPSVNVTPDRAAQGFRGDPVHLHKNHDMYAIGQMTHEATHDGENHLGYTQREGLSGRKQEYLKAKEGDWDAFSGPTANDAFLRGTLNPIGDDRMSPEETLESKFLSDPSLQEDSAKQVLKQMLLERNLMEPTMLGHNNNIKRWRYGEEKSELDLVKESNEGRDDRLSQARVQNKSDKLSKRKALKRAQGLDEPGLTRGEKKQTNTTVKQKKGLMSELLKATKGRRDGTGNGGLNHVEPNSGGVLSRMSENERARTLHPESHWSVDEDGEAQRAHREHTGKSKQAKKGNLEGWWSNH